MSPSARPKREGRPTRAELKRRISALEDELDRASVLVEELESELAAIRRPGPGSTTSRLLDPARFLRSLFS